MKEGLRLRTAVPVLAVVAWSIYHPAFNRLFASDQIVYLAEREGRTSLADGLRLYDYNATRRYWKGDEALFRPLLFTWLAVGTRLFSYHYVGWNVANVALHVLVAVALFQLLLTIRPSPFALPAALLFLVLKPPLELVLWNHLGGYLLACLFLALGLRSLVRLTDEDNQRSIDRATYVLAFSAASFCHEAMVPAAGLAAIYLVGLRWRQHRQAGVRPAIPSAPTFAVAAAPLLIFGAFYAVHLKHVARLAYVDRQDVQGLLGPGAVLQVVPRTVQIVSRWVLELALPAAVTFANTAFSRFARTFAFSWTSPLHLANALLAIAALALIGTSISRNQLGRRWPMLILMAGMVFAYGAILSFGRPLEELINITYYPYIFGVLLAVFLYALLDFDRLQSWRGAAAWLLLVGFVTVHGTGTAATARAVESQNHYPALYLDRVIAFVHAHRSEPDFSFAIEPHPESLDPSVYLIEGYPIDPQSTSSPRLTQILFRRYYNETRPRYVLDGTATKLVSPAP